MLGRKEGERERGERGEKGREGGRRYGVGNERREWGGYYKEREGVVGGSRDWEWERSERGTEGGMEGETKGGSECGFTKAGREGWGRGKEGEGRREGGTEGRRDGGKEEREGEWKV